MKRLDHQLAALRAELLQCQRCARDEGVQPIVSLACAPRAMLVGQAPGKTEAAGGRPFAGRAGKTLFAWLARAGIDEATARDRIYISAVTRCYPGPSPSGRGDRVPAGFHIGPVGFGKAVGQRDHAVRKPRPFDVADAVQGRPFAGSEAADAFDDRFDQIGAGGGEARLRAKLFDPGAYLQREDLLGTRWSEVHCVLFLGFIGAGL